MIDQFFTDTDDLASELATDIANAFRYKAKQLGADVSIDSLCDFHGYVQGTIADRLRGVAQAVPARGDVTLTKEQAYALFLIVDTTARIERGAYPTTNYLRELLLPTYRAWHDANPGTAHPALVVPSQDRPEFTAKRHPVTLRGAFRTIP